MPIFEEVRTVTANGRLVIPWSIQRALGLDHGGPVRFRVEDGAVTLQAAEPRETGASDNSGSRTADSKTALIAELKTLLDIADRDRATETPSP